MGADKNFGQGNVSKSRLGIFERLFGKSQKETHFNQNIGDLHGDMYNAENATFNKTTNNTTNHYYSNDLSSDAELPHSAEILPYLANRDTQAFALEQFTADHLDTNKNQVIVCVIPGAINEVPLGFMDRCEKVLLYELLLLYGKDVLIPPWKPHWPSENLETEARMTRLKNDLRKKLRLKLNADESELIQALVGMKRPVSCRYHVIPQQWDQSEQNLVQDWIDFWLNLPDLECDNNIFVFLGLYYDKKDKNLSSDTETDSAKTKNMKAYVEQLKKDKRPNLICLEELESLCGNDINKWASDVCPNAVQNIDEGLLNDARLQAKASELCPDDDYKPLKELVDGMREALLYACSHR